MRATAVDVGAVIEQKLLGRKGTHAVGDDHDGDVRVVCLCSSDRQIEVIDQCRPPVGPEVAGFVGGGQGGAVSAVVMAVHRETRRGQRLGNVVVSAQVLTHAVDEHDDACDGLAVVRAQR